MADFASKYAFAFDDDDEGIQNTLQSQHEPPSSILQWGDDPSPTHIFPSINSSKQLNSKESDSNPCQISSNQAQLPEEQITDQNEQELGEDNPTQVVAMEGMLSEDQDQNNVVQQVYQWDKVEKDQITRKVEQDMQEEDEDNELEEYQNKQELIHENQNNNEDSHSLQDQEQIKANQQLVQSENKKLFVQEVTQPKLDPVIEQSKSKKTERVFTKAKDAQVNAFFEALLSDSDDSVSDAGSNLSEYKDDGEEDSDTDTNILFKPPILEHAILKPIEIQTEQLDNSRDIPQTDSIQPISLIANIFEDANIQQPFETNDIDETQLYQDNKIDQLQNLSIEQLYHDLTEPEDIQHQFQIEQIVEQEYKLHEQVEPANQDQVHIDENIQPLISKQDDKFMDAQIQNKDEFIKVDENQEGSSQEWVRIENDHEKIQEEQVQEQEIIEQIEKQYEPYVVNQEFENINDNQMNDEDEIQIVFKSFEEVFQLSQVNILNLNYPDSNQNLESIAQIYAIQKPRYLHPPQTRLVRFLPNSCNLVQLSYSDLHPTLTPVYTEKSVILITLFHDLLSSIESVSTLLSKRDPLKLKLLQNLQTYIQTLDSHSSQYKAWELLRLYIEQPKVDIFSPEGKGIRDKAIMMLLDGKDLREAIGHVSIKRENEHAKKEGLDSITIGAAFDHNLEIDYEQMTMEMVRREEWTEALLIASMYCSQKFRAMIQIQYVQKFYNQKHPLYSLSMIKSDNIDELFNNDKTKDNLLKDWKIHLAFIIKNIDKIQDKKEQINQFIEQLSAFLIKSEKDIWTLLFLKLLISNISDKSLTKCHYISYKIDLSISFFLSLAILLKNSPDDFKLHKTQSAFYRSLIYSRQYQNHDLAHDQLHYVIEHRESLDSRIYKSQYFQFMMRELKQQEYQCMRLKQSQQSKREVKIQQNNNAIKGNSTVVKEKVNYWPDKNEIIKQNETIKVSENNQNIKEDEAIKDHKVVNDKLKKEINLIEPLEKQTISMTTPRKKENDQDSQTPQAATNNQNQLNSSILTGFKGLFRRVIDQAQTTINQSSTNIATQSLKSSKQIETDNKSEKMAKISSLEQQDFIKFQQVKDINADQQTENIENSLQLQQTKIDQKLNEIKIQKQNDKHDLLIQRTSDHQNAKNIDNNQESTTEIKQSQPIDYSQPINKNQQMLPQVPRFQPPRFPGRMPPPRINFPLIQTSVQVIQNTIQDPKTSEVEENPIKKEQKIEQLQSHQSNPFAAMVPRNPTVQQVRPRGRPQNMYASLLHQQEYSKQNTTHSNLPPE